MTGPDPPIGTQVSRLAAAGARRSPRSPARAARITRGELDASTNRLARAYAERGVGVKATT